MADEARLHDLLDLVEQARAEGDKVTEQKAVAAYKAASTAAPSDPSAGGGTLSIGPFDTGIQTPQWLDRGLAGAGKAGYDLARGAGQLVGLVSRKDVADSRALDAPLMATTAGKVGNLAGNVALAAPTAVIPGANTVTGAGVIGAGLGLLQPSTSTKETLANTAIGGVLGAGGQWVGGKLAGAATQKLADLSLIHI